MLLTIALADVANVWRYVRLSVARGKPVGHVLLVNVLFSIHIC